MKTLERTTLMLAVCAMLLCQQASAREWTDSTGTFKVEAELVGISDGLVSLKKASDGAVIRVPMAKLSAADQAYLKSLETQPAELTATAKASDLPLHTAGCIGLVVLDPKPILQHEALDEAPLKALVEQGVAGAGIDFRKIDRVTIMSYLPEDLTSQSPEDARAVVVIEMAEPVDPQPVLDMVPGGFEEITVAGKTCLKLAKAPGPMAPLPVFCKIDEKTFAIGTNEKALANALTATSDAAEMTALFNAAGENNEVRYLANIAAMQGLIDKAMTEVPAGMLPPQLIEIVGLVKKMESVTFAVDLDGDPSIEALMATADEAAAGELLTKINEGIAKLPELMDEAAKNVPAEGPPGPTNPAMAMQMASGAVQNIDEFLAIEQTGAAVKMSVKFPSDTGPLADKLMEIAAGLAMFLGPNSPFSNP